MPPAGGPLATYPGARRPDRRRVVDANGVGLAVYEWGDPGAPPVVLTHGGFDFAATFDSLAPRLADGGWRVVAWDQRGHGDSDHAALYSWDADVRDLAIVVDSVGPVAVPLLGHSKGGGLAMHLAEAAPHRVSHLVNLDGLPSRRPTPDIVEHERTRQTLNDVTAWLDHRRRTHEAARKPGTFEDVARRRAKMNPRLDMAWIHYLATIGAREDAEGWRWKIDPSLRFGGFGPFRPEWSMERAPGIGVPFLGVLGLEVEEMGWGSRPEDIEPYLPPGAEFHSLEGVGHFVHVERPDLIAGLVLDFLARRSARRGWR